jgi:hypothetical protein
MTDVILVFSACFSLDKDPEARRYALLEYNCYFFSWTIVMIVVRHILPFELPTATTVESRSRIRLADATKSLTTKIVDALLNLVLGTITSFRQETGTKLYPGLSKREMAVWGLPVPVVRALMSQCLKVRLHFGLEKELQNRVQAQLEQYTPEILNHVLQNQTKVDADVKSRLWLFDLNTAFTPHFKSKALEIIWDGILDTLAQGHADMKPEVFDLNINQLPTLHRLKYRLFGKNVIQFSQIWNEALQAALPAARNAGRGISQGKSHGDMFKLAFDAGSAAALEAAKDVVARTKDSINNPKRDKMWETVWSVWKDVWETTRSNAQKEVVTLIENTLEDIVGWVAQDVVAELGNSQAQRINATIQYDVSFMPTSCD